LNVNYKTVMLLTRNIGQFLHDLGMCKYPKLNKAKKMPIVKR
jgi:hypothetical protein